MTEEQIETVADESEEGNEPIYYKPKSLSLIATIALWASWVVLIVFLLISYAQIAYIIDVGTQNQQSLMQMLTDPGQGAQVRGYVYTNVLIPLFSGLAFFILLQAASIGLNSLLEIDFNLREIGK